MLAHSSSLILSVLLQHKIMLGVDISGYFKALFLVLLNNLLKKFAGRFFSNKTTVKHTVSAGRPLRFAQDIKKLINFPANCLT